ncbi:MAG: cytochrome c biogenesis protein CcsA [Chitinophagaceae bacterium]|nr:cytochrome c biogenesis protein CcsA [Chitinophagaceae bacterium]MCB9045468.1 cytochrome c biogenesis protein CcsA [Chitinophagales bacterium]
MDTQYIGEHLGPGQLGHFFVIASFVMALFSGFSYYRAALTEHTDQQGSMAWLRMGRNGFVLHAAAVMGVFFTLFYIITNHLFEYHYAWKHSDLSLSSKYLLSCFWEGQEGSFLLWSFWHSVLGIIVMLTAKKMESRVMTIIAVVQVALATMLLGYYFGNDISIGSSPFILLRDKMVGAPIFAQPNYLQDYITDGNGLNILLQNYWMVIHPPILFLGFSSTLIPFAYTIAALWKGGDYKEWIKPTWVWSLFAGAVLGTGIMMGGAWAYESLTFGGYWAWDPVENASLVPWLTLVAGLHTLIVYKVTGRSFIMTAIMFILTYALIWYSTFLTRTGVLGDTSVHAFTGEGASLYWHLLIVIAVIMAISIWALARKWKSLPRVKSEEKVNSREFWMFIGSFVLFLSALQIIISTSIPVWSPLAKLITGKDVAPPVDPVAHYNGIQVWVAIVISLLSASVLYLKFNKSDNKTFWKRIAIVSAIALVMSLLIGYYQQITTPQYAVMLFACSFTVVGMLNYAISIQKGKLMKLGPSVSHLGFGLALLGILLSSYKKEVISYNTTGIIIPYSDDKMENIRQSMENVVLYKDIAVPMGEYDVTYLGDSTSETDPRTFYKVQYEKRDTATGKVVESFVLHPDAFVNPKGQQGGMSANPDSKHYLSKDIFTYVTSVIDPAKRTDSNAYKSHKVRIGDTIFINRGYLIFDGFNTNVDNENYIPEKGDIAVAARITLKDLNGAGQQVAPVYYIRNNFQHYIEDTLAERRTYVRLSKIVPEENAAEIMVRQPEEDYIVMKALLFPYINVLWLGVIVMVVGFLLSMLNRITKKA